MKRLFECSFVIGVRNPKRWVSSVEVVGNDIVIRTSDQPCYVSEDVARSIRSLVFAAKAKYFHRTYECSLVDFEDSLICAVEDVTQPQDPGAGSDG